MNRISPEDPYAFDPYGRDIDGRTPVGHAFDDDPEVKRLDHKERQSARLEIEELIRQGRKIGRHVLVDELGMPVYKNEFDGTRPQGRRAKRD